MDNLNCPTRTQLQFTTTNIFVWGKETSDIPRDELTRLEEGALVNVFAYIKYWVWLKSLPSICFIPYVEHETSSIRSSQHLKFEHSSHWDILALMHLCKVFKLHKNLFSIKFVLSWESNCLSYFVRHISKDNIWQCETNKASLFLLNISTFYCWTLVSTIASSSLLVVSFS